MARKSELRSTNLLADLTAALPDAEAAVVSDAMTWGDQGDSAAPQLKEAVVNLNAIRSAISAMEKVTKKSNKPAVEPAAKAAA